MCLGCDPMEHDRKSRVQKVKDGLAVLVKKVEKEAEEEGAEEEESEEETGTLPGASERLRLLLEKIGEVVVQLGNAQEALEGKAEKTVIQGVKKALEKAKDGLDKVKDLNGVKEGEELDGKLEEAKKKLDELTKNGGSGGALDTLANGSHAGSLQQITSAGADWRKEYSSAKDKISEAIHKVREVLTALQKEVPEVKDKLNGQEGGLLKAIKDILYIVGSTRCVHCKHHKDKCGKLGEKKTCNACHQQYMDGFPSPLQAFLEDRLPGFSCDVVRNDNSEQPYPPAASHLGHCGGSGQCCPLPMGFRNQFHKGGISDCTGARLYGILYFFSNENMMQSCVYTLVRVTAELSATTPQVLGDVFGFFRGGIGEKEQEDSKKCNHDKDPKESKNNGDYFCGWCASGLRDEVKDIQWIEKGSGKDKGGKYRGSVGEALVAIKGDKGTGGAIPYLSANTTPSNLSTLTDSNHYVPPLTGELYTAVNIIKYYLYYRKHPAIIDGPTLDNQ